jgi:hypothetical protein
VGERHAFEPATGTLDEMHDVPAGDEEAVRVSNLAKPLDEQIAIFHVPWPRMVDVNAVLPCA